MPISDTTAQVEDYIEDIDETVGDFVALLSDYAIYDTEWGIESTLAGLADIPAKAKGHIIMQMLGRKGNVNGEPFTHDEKVDALSMAAVLGPDHAQDLYKLAVLITKLA